MTSTQLLRDINAIFGFAAVIMCLYVDRYAFRLLDAKQLTRGDVLTKVGRIVFMFFVGVRSIWPNNELTLFGITIGLGWVTLGLFWNAKRAHILRSQHRDPSAENPRDVL